MSGTPKGLGINRTKEPSLPPRKDLGNPVVPELPARDFINVVITRKSLEKEKVLARVRRKSQIGTKTTLNLEVSDYIAGIPYASKWIKPLETKKEKQKLQVFLHELMHTALWDDTTITHSPDTESILHFYVDGETLQPTSWDLAVMKGTANRIGNIFIDHSAGDAYIYIAIKDAVELWNEWIGREFFKLL